MSKYFYVIKKGVKNFPKKINSGFFDLLEQNEMKVSKEDVEGLVSLVSVNYKYKGIEEETNEFKITKNQKNIQRIKKLSKNLGLKQSSQQRNNDNTHLVVEVDCKNKNSKNISQILAKFSKMNI